MIKPVYVFSGFLDSGKTSAIKEVLYDPRFNEGESTLIIVMEEGKIVQRGSHDQLMGEEGHYQRLVRSGDNGGL